MNHPNTQKDIVLIVEDTIANHEVIATFLGDMNVSCESAYDGMEAITRCNAVGQNYYSLILMDINLPHMNGFETAGKLRESGVQAPIVAITATSKDDRRIDEARAVFDALLFKPFNASEFFQALSPYIKNSTLRPLEAKNAPENVIGAPLHDAQICNVERALSNMGNSMRLFTKHFNHFKQNNVDLALRMKHLIQSENHRECAMLCHSIKGLSGMLGLTALYEHVIQLEHLLNSQEKPKEDIAKLLAAIEDDIRLVCKVQF